jgi:hypothetical protein
MELALQQQGITRPSVVKRLIAKAGVR